MPTLGPPGVTSRDLLRRAREGSTRALSALVGRELPRLRRWASGRLPAWARRGVDTADLVQDALIRTLRHLHTFEPQGRGALQAYLRQSVVNAMTDERRRAFRRPIHSELSVEVAASAPSPLEELLGHETSARYLAALHKLSETDRLAIVARLEQQRSFEQLGLILGKSPDAARMQVNRALERLTRVMAGG
jgi:RNA polymerase sigma factor (sigma-70 family)